jgi:hypothetical protein
MGRRSHWEGEKREQADLPLHRLQQCYWCHVAERTIYSNPAIATLMNQWFISIKVDREERRQLTRSRPSVSN